MSETIGADLPVQIPEAMVKSLWKGVHPLLERGVSRRTILGAGLGFLGLAASGAFGKNSNLDLRWSL